MNLFFFSSRRRHTRCGRDWSSDVCSSDLISNKLAGMMGGMIDKISSEYSLSVFFLIIAVMPITIALILVLMNPRSEERRVGKECDCRMVVEPQENKIVKRKHLVKLTLKHH